MPAVLGGKFRGPGHSEERGPPGPRASRVDFMAIHPTAVEIFHFIRDSWNSPWSILWGT